jgi:uncharacterized membrane protein
MFKIMRIPKAIAFPLLLVFILTILRVIIFDKYSLIYILWNILLAFIPFFISSILLYLKQNNKLKDYLFILLGLLWLLFLPNAPYIVTDLIHIGVVRSVPVLFDSILLFTSAYVGLMFGMYSIFHIENILIYKYSKNVTLIITTTILLLASFGIYLGRFFRFNSWDVFVAPFSSSDKLLKMLSSSPYHMESLIYIPLFFVFICTFYYSWKSFNKN